MQYKSFQIKNFKGVRDTKIAIDDGKIKATTLIGLNESGKTTILEAIYSFSPDRESQPLFSQDSLITYETARIPRDQLFSFSDTISVTAVLGFDDIEKQSIAQLVGTAIGGICFKDDLKGQMTVTDWAQYDNSKVIKRGTSWSPGYPRVKTGQQKNWRVPTILERQQIWKAMKSRFPAIAYFPFFLSDIPARVYLRGFEEDKSNTFYRTIFEDILYQIGPEFTIKNQVLDRIEADPAGDASKTISSFWASPRRGMVQQLVDKASIILSKTITDRWNEIFKGQLNDAAGVPKREIVINFGLDQVDGVIEAVPYIEFAIKDGANRFNIADRSLGFRWFFAFYYLRNSELSVSPTPEHYSYSTNLLLIFTQRRKKSCLIVLTT